MAKHILVVDAGTTGIKVCLMDKDGQIVARGYRTVPQIYPQPGWVEHNPMDLWQLTLAAAEEAFSQYGSGWQAVDCIGITNQRETVILWDKETGEPVYNAIVWQCRRTAEACTRLKHDPILAREIQERTGLVVDAYFSASKIQWLFQHCPEAKRLAEKGQLLAGTVDTWLLWQLTGRQVHATDYTNASRTMLFNIQDMAWDDSLLQQFEVPEAILPQVLQTAGDFGHTDPKQTGGASIPITCLIGDQQSALYGQKCWQPGDSKNTFGTGAFLMMNLGPHYLLSEGGLLTTLACDAMGNPAYALEGAVFIAGAALEWLKNSLGVVSSFEEADALAAGLESNDGIYMVPAFVGLGAPYWDSEARGLVTGLTQGAGKANLARACLESMAYQTDDVVRLMLETSHLTLDGLKVDGGVSRSNFLMQFLADLLAVPVYRMRDAELTAKGAGYLAGLAIGLWPSPDVIRDLPEEMDCFTPQLDSRRQQQFREGWQVAVKQVLLPSQIRIPESVISGMVD